MTSLFISIEIFGLLNKDKNRLLLLTCFFFSIKNRVWKLTTTTFRLETEYKCSECNKVLSTVSALNRHLRKKHDIESSERTRKCPRGDESEANSDTLSVATSSISASSSGQTEDCLLN